MMTKLVTFRDVELLYANRDFMKLWAGQTISELGSRITRDGLPLAAVLTLRATPAQMGLLAAVGSAPVLLLGLVAGVWVDRLRRHPIMIVADLGRAALLITIPAAALLAGRIVQWIGLGATLIGASVIAGFIGFLLPLAGGPPIMAAAFLAAGQILGDMSRTVYDINSVSLRQVITPGRLLGRTTASMQLLEAGVGPIGALVGGVLAEVIGVRQAVFVSALGSLFASLWLILSPVRKLPAQPSPVE